VVSRRPILWPTGRGQDSRPQVPVAALTDLMVRSGMIFSVALKVHSSGSVVRVVR
jgi:hypothetical protein